MHPMTYYLLGLVSNNSPCPKNVHIVIQKIKRWTFFGGGHRVIHWPQLLTAAALQYAVTAPPASGVQIVFWTDKKRGTKSRGIVMRALLRKPRRPQLARYVAMNELSVTAFTHARHAQLSRQPIVIHLSTSKTSLRRAISFTRLRSDLMGPHSACRSYPEYGENWWSTLMILHDRSRSVSVNFRRAYFSRWSMVVLVPVCTWRQRRQKLI